MRALLLAVLCWLVAGADARADPGVVLSRVRGAGAVRCGGAAGPGLALPDAAGVWRGLMVDLCRAVTVAVLGPQANTTFRPYLREADFAPAAQAGIDVVFVTAGDLITHRLLDTLLPGPVVYYRTIGLAVDPRSTLRRAADIGDRTICFEPGSIADRALEDFFAARHLPLHPMPFQEAEEMQDAFDDHRCGAMAGDVISLAGHGDRILPDVIAATAVLATSRLDDARWAAVIRWTMATLLRAEANGGDATRLLPIEAPALGLAAGWQARVVADVGDYAAIYRRNLTVPRGPNALAADGGLLVPLGSE